MTITPRLDYVAIKFNNQKENVTKSGIVLTAKQTNDDRQQIGEVIAVGSGRILESGNVMPLGLNPGDKVIFNKYAGTEILVEEESYLLIHERDIIAIVS